MINDIPHYLVPSIYIEEDNSNALSSSGSQPYKVLLIGQSYKVTEDEAPVLIKSLEQAVNYYGKGSILSEQVSAFLANNTDTPLYTLALRYAEGAEPATASVKFSLPSRGKFPTGVLQLMIAGRKIELRLESPDFLTTTTGDSPKTVFDIEKLMKALEAQISQISPFLTITSTKDTLKLKTLEKGVICNLTAISINSDIEQPIKNIQIELTPFSGGVKEPICDGLEDKIGDHYFNVVACAFTGSETLKQLTSLFEERSRPPIGQDTLTVACTPDDSLRINSRLLCLMPVKESQINLWQLGSALAGQISFHASLDPARPFTGLELKQVNAPKTNYSFKERNELLKNGFSTFTVSDSGKMLIERLVTTYTQNSVGVEDASYRDINIILTLSYLKWDFKSTFARKYPRYKLGFDGVIVGSGVMTPNLAKAEALGLYEQWQRLGLVEGFDTFKKSLIVERNASDPSRLDFKLQPDLINQLMVLGVQLQFIV